MHERRAQTIALGDGITAVDTEYARPNMDASHLIVDTGRAAFVDTGHNHAVPLLLDALRQADVDVADVDYVFLTHIHLDHAGGAGLLMQQLPNARCVVHPRGAAHMIDPARLIAGTEAVYGKQETRELYGDIQAIEERRVVTADDRQWFALGEREMQTLHTAGHALHHYSLFDPKSAGVFTGDSFGVSYRELDTDAGEFVLPSSTPTHFDPVAAHLSVDRIMACDPKQLFLTHYSRVTDLERLAHDMHASIDAYEQIAMLCRDEDDRFDAIHAAMRQFLFGRARQHGFTGSDDDLHALLDGDIRLNAQGLVSWLARLDKEEQKSDR